jgi:hypothetical protein
MSMTKYMFGYYLFHGKVNAITWPVIHGVRIGAFNSPVQAHEITEAEWNTQTISALAQKYPYIEPPLSSPV